MQYRTLRPVEAGREPERELECDPDCDPDCEPEREAEWEPDFEPEREPEREPESEPEREPGAFSVGDRALVALPMDWVGSAEGKRVLSCLFDAFLSEEETRMLADCRVLALAEGRELVEPDDDVTEDELPAP